jgi:hypothetical protein
VVVPQNATYKIRNWTETVHYSNDGQTPACGPIRTHKSWSVITLNQVTCSKCIAKFGEDHNHSEDPKDEYTLRMEQRAAERAARRAEREAAL